MKKLTALLLAGAMAFSFAACDTEDDLGYIGSSVTNMGEFDCAKTLSDIRLNGKTVTLPCNLSELGSGFTAENGKEYDAGTMFDLKYNGKSVGNVRLSCGPDGDTAGSTINFIEFRSESGVEVSGISFKSKIDDVKTRFGTPDGTDFDCVRYNGANGQYVEFTHAGGNNQRIQSVRINLKGE